MENEINEMRKESEILREKLMFSEMNGGVNSNTLSFDKYGNTEVGSNNISLGSIVTKKKRFNSYNKFGEERNMGIH